MFGWLKKTTKAPHDHATCTEYHSGRDHPCNIAKRTRGLEYRAQRIKENPISRYGTPYGDVELDHRTGKITVPDVPGFCPDPERLASSAGGIFRAGTGPTRRCRTTPTAKLKPTHRN